MFKKILLPVDGSSSNRKTWDYAKHLIEEEDAKIEILYVNEDIWMNSEKTDCDDGVCKTINLFDTCAPQIVDINASKNQHKKKKEEKICEIQSQVKDFFGDFGNNVTMKLVNGDPAHQIMSLSKKHAFDVIIMSTHGVSALKKLTLGSVTHKVVNHAEVPVLIIR